MIISAIVAHDKNYLIGGENKLLWHIPADLKRFKKITTGHTVVMGRKTFESIGKPLPNRLNIILTKDKDFKAEGCLIFNDVISLLNDINKEGEIFIIGGGQIYKELFPLINRIYVTLVDGEYVGDAYFPQYDKKDWDCFYEEKGKGFAYQTWIRKK